ncbi:MAG: DEAD/DEAH box helicase family protein [Gammaproteobacteria bacterium]|nr:DEAD/DEAH box helicase family protein [Gammaproteobacteria bacterium]
MAKSVIGYDKELPEIPERCAWLVPTNHLVKDLDVSTGWRVENGRRKSELLLVPKIRAAVDEWRNDGYPGGSDVSRRLFEYWFDEDHDVAGFAGTLRYYFCQREAIETLAWLVEIASVEDTHALINTYATTFNVDLVSPNVAIETRPDGTRRLRRFVPELNRTGEQELPPDNLRRFAFKLATGAGKTWVMAMVVVWSHLHKKLVPGSPLSTNFLIVAPNVIVYQRLAKDFAANRVFHELPLVPPEWKNRFRQKVLLRGDAVDPDPSGNLILANIQQLYERQHEAAPTNAVDAIVGRRPSKDPAAAHEKSLLERAYSFDDLIVLNDEAHHVHDHRLKWTQSLLSAHQAVAGGLTLWLDFSATPKDQGGMYFPWTVCDYPLAQAVEDRIVKAPVIVTKEDDSAQPAEDPEGINRTNVVEKYAYWIDAAVHRLQEHSAAYAPLGIRPVLFIMVEKNNFADAIGESLRKNGAFKPSEVLVIHTDGAGDVRKKDLEEARRVAQDIDAPKNETRVIVSVMMLREGWDVRNVSVVLGLRPFTASAEILPEQVVGRGLRLMEGVSPDKTQTLEVLGTRNLLRVLQEQLEAEGVGVISKSTDPTPPETVQPLKQRMGFDIGLPITKPSLTHDVQRLEDIDTQALRPIFESEDLSEPYRVILKMDFATPEAGVGQDEFQPRASLASDLLTDITNKALSLARLPMQFQRVYPIVREYVEHQCFGRDVDLEDDAVRSHLSRLNLREGIAKYLATELAKLSVERRSIELEVQYHQLSDTKPFTWRRDLPLWRRATKTVFNRVATYNRFERQFAQFLERAEDVVRFGALATTEQGGSAAEFRIDYLKPSGAIGFYYPDWVMVQARDGAETHWLVETKGRVWEGTEEKDAAAEAWCRRVTKATGQEWRYTRVNQNEFTGTDKTFREFLVNRAIKRAEVRQRESKPTTQEEIREWREEGRA